MESAAHKWQDLTFFFGSETQANIARPGNVLQRKISGVGPGNINYSMVTEMSIHGQSPGLGEIFLTEEKLP